MLQMLQGVDTKEYSICVYVHTVTRNVAMYAKDVHSEGLAIILQSTCSIRIGHCQANRLRGD